MDRMNGTANEDVTDLEQVTKNFTNSLKTKFLEFAELCLSGKSNEEKRYKYCH